VWPQRKFGLNYYFNIGLLLPSIDNSFYFSFSEIILFISQSKYLFWTYIMTLIFFLKCYLKSIPYKFFEKNLIIKNFKSYDSFKYKSFIFLRFFWFNNFFAMFELKFNITWNWFTFYTIWRMFNIFLDLKQLIVWARQSFKVVRIILIPCDLYTLPKCNH